MYVSYGTVAPQGDAYPGIYREAIEQLAGLDVRILLNTGRRDPAALGALPAGVHAERWVHEAAVLPYVAAMVSHGGAGSVRTALSAGVPLAVLPRFGDQPLNARAVAGGRRRARGRGRRRAPRRRRRAAHRPRLRGRGDRHRGRGGRACRRPARRSRCCARRSRPSRCERYLSLNARMRSSYWAASRA